MAAGRAGGVAALVPRPRRCRGRGAPEDERSLAAELAERLRDSVRAHLVSDVPVGVLAERRRGQRPARRAGGAGVRRAAADVLDRLRGALVRRARPGAARRVAAGPEHHEAILGADAAQRLPAIAAAFDEPYADSSALPSDAVSRLTAQHVKVALSGEGGDELFGGYQTYAADLLAPRLARVARVARPVVERIPSSSRRVSLDYKARRFVRAAGLPALERHHGWKEILAPGVRARLLAAAARRARSGRSCGLCCARATPRPRAPRRWRGCRTSTSRRTSPTTC